MRSRRTLLTIDHFREIRRFNEWLDKLAYPGEVPGIPAGALHVEEFPLHDLAYQ